MDLTKLLQLIINMNIFDAKTERIGSASNSTVTLSLPAYPGKRWYVVLVTVGYSAAPTGGLLTVLESANPVFRVPIADARPTAVAPLLRGAPGNAMTITLSAGGSGITGYANVGAYLGE